MIAFRFLCLGVTWALLLMAPNARAQASGADCSIEHGNANFLPSSMNDLREVTVVRPDGGVVYIFSPRLGIYGIAAGDRGAVELNPRSQKGSQYAEDGKLHQRNVFDVDGTYQLVVVGSAKNASSPIIRYHRVVCRLDFSGTQGFLSAKTVQVNGSEPLSTSAACPSNQMSPLSSCRPASSCNEQGHGYCCTQAVPGEPCFCDNCCVAKAGLAVH